MYSWALNRYSISYVGSVSSLSSIDQQTTEVTFELCQCFKQLTIIVTANKPSTDF